MTSTNIVQIFAPDGDALYYVRAVRISDGKTLDEQALEGRRNAEHEAAKMARFFECDWETNY